MSGWTPETLTTSPGALAIFEFDPNNPDDIVRTSTGAVVRVINSLDRTESLTAASATGGTPVLLAGNSGADGTKRVLQFHASTINSNLYDPSTNWLDAGGVNGPAGAALVDLANSANLSKSGSFTTIIALKIDTAYSYEAGPIWGSLASPGPLHYAQLRVNMGSNGQGANIADDNGQANNAQGGITSGWHVMTMIKNGATLTYRLDGKTIQTSTVTSNSAFIATDFMIGGGFPQGASANLGQENGVPAPYVGEFQAYTGALAGTDLVNAEALAGKSVGLSLTSAATTSGGTAVLLPDAPANYSVKSGDTVYGGAGAATVTASSGSVLAYGGTGSLRFAGGNASVTVIGGSGGGAFTGGSAGSNVLVACGGNTTLTGGGNNDRLFGSANGNDVMVAAHGRESLVGGTGNTTITGGATASATIFTNGNTTVSGGNAGGDTIVGGSGTLSATLHGDAVFAGSGAISVTGGTSGSDSIIGGTGTLVVAGHGANMLVTGGSGVSWVDTGTGANLVFTGSGTMTLDEGRGVATIVLGGGNAQINEGAGTVTYDLIKGAAGGIDVISGFRPGTDRIALFGYGGEQPQIETGSGGTVLGLSDGTRVTLLDVAGPGQLLAA